MIRGVTRSELWQEIRERIHSFGRNGRKLAIGVLSAYLEEERISSRELDLLLLEWDCENFPEQIPSPVRDWITKQSTSTKDIDAWS